MFARFCDDLRLEHKSDSNLAFLAVFGRHQVNDTLGGLEGFNVRKLNFSRPQALCLFDLIPVEYFNREIGTNAGRLIEEQ
jgi:hypothetical protein